MPSFASDWGFNLASTGPDPLSLSAADVDGRLADRGCNSLRFYDGETHAGLFRLPKHVRTAMDEQAHVITESNPVVVF